MAGKNAAKEAVKPPVAEAKEPKPAVFRDRIVELRRVKASELRRNPKNFRMHPTGQQHAMRSILADVGFVDAVICRDDNGTLELLNGHLRADLSEDAEVPVLIVDVNAEEADRVLATFDPVSDLALVDGQKLEDLLKGFKMDDAEVRHMFASIHYDVEAESAKKVAKGEDDPAKREVPGMALQPHEHYDYLVVLASSTRDWNVLCELLGLKPVKRHKSSGTARAIRAGKLIELLQPKAAAAEPVSS